jgi:hypothetical protein
LATIPFLFQKLKVPDAPMISWINLFIAICGIIFPISLIFLWTGMFRYWTQCDTSARAIKRIWFVVLLFGFWYGAVVYYLIAYLRRGTERKPTGPSQNNGRLTVIIGYFLLIGWGALFAFVALVFIFPKTVGPILHPIADYFVLVPTFLLFATALYGVMRLYRAGMKYSRT